MKDNVIKDILENIKIANENKDTLSNYGEILNAVSELSNDSKALLVDVAVNFVGGIVNDTYEIQEAFEDTLDGFLEEEYTNENETKCEECPDKELCESAVKVFEFHFGGKNGTDKDGRESEPTEEKTEAQDEKESAKVQVQEQQSK